MAPPIENPVINAPYEEPSRHFVFDDSGITDTIADGRRERPGHETVALVRQRLGQSSFRLLVIDAYDRRCAVTREQALPVVDSAHIRPVSEGGSHRVGSGLLLRSDVHTLFDRGYVTMPTGHSQSVWSGTTIRFSNRSDG